MAGEDEGRDEGGPGLAAAVLALLALAKLGMPLHYDIGDKERYEV